MSLLELLVVLAVVAILASLAVPSWSGVQARADGADALARLRTMGVAVGQYAADHDGRLPPLFPGQVLEYEPGRGGRIVTECAAYLGLGENEDRFVVTSLMPRAYARLREPANPADLRVYVMNANAEGPDGIVQPFGRVVTGGQPPVGPLPLASLGLPLTTWMMSTADQQHPAVAGAFWRANTPAEPPLGDRRAVFRFDGSASLANLEE